LPAAIVYYHLYKPLRNRLRRYALRPCLHQLWFIFQHIRNGKDCPYPMRSLRGRVQPWEISLLVRELVLNAGDHGRTFRRYDDFADAINGVKALGEKIHKQVITPQTVMDEASAIAHQQAPWFEHSAHVGLLRYWRLLRTPDVARIVERMLGVDVRKVFQIGMVGGGELMGLPYVDTRRNFADIRIAPEEVARFYAPITTTVDGLRERLQSAQRYDRNWAYTWNALEATPLIQLDSAFPHRFTAPVPELQLRAFAQGVYYALVNDAEFGNAFGKAFETYVGDALHEIFPGPMYRVQAETPYQVGRNQKHGADWIVSDRTGHLFFECKTKRVRLEAKMAGDVAAVEGQLDAMAKFVVQLYKNIRDAERGLTAWRPDRLPIYPVVLTLEDWHLFAPWMVAKLNALIVAALQKAAIPEAVLQEMPYTITSVDDFFGGALVASATGIESFFRPKTQPAYATWMLRPYANQFYPELVRQTHKLLFWDDLKDILPYAELFGVPATDEDIM
jgi:hypothetical protein